MTEPPSGWATPDEPTGWAQPAPPGYGPPAGYGQPAGYGPPADYGSPQGWYGAAPQPGVVPLRPLGVGELLDGSIKILRRYPRPTLGLSAVIAVVVTALNVLIVLIVNHADDLSTTNDDGSPTFHFGTGTSASTIPVQLLASLAGLVLTGALVAVVGKAVLGHQTSFSEVWAQVRPRLWALLGLTLLTGLIVIAPVVVVVLLALLASATGSDAVVALAVLAGFVAFAAFLYLATRLALAPAVLVLEKAGIRASLSRSSVLVRGAWWRTFWVLLLTRLIGGVLGGILGIPIGIIAVVGGDPGSVGVQVLIQIAAGVAGIIVSPFVAGARALIYVDRRMRAEGLDVSLAAAAAGVQPG